MTVNVLAHSYWVQLRRFTITTGRLAQGLAICPNTTGLVMSARKDIVSAYPVDYAHTELQALGFP